MISEADRSFLRAILDKDNERIKGEITDAESDILFKLGFEGGGLEVTRYRTAEGKTYFRTSGTGMRLDKNDDEEWVGWEDEPGASFAGALAELKMGTEILAIRPLLVHPDFLDTVKEYIESMLIRVTSHDRQRMGRFFAATADEWFKRLRS